MSNIVQKTAWNEFSRLRETFGGVALYDTLYGWFCAEKDTLATGDAGVHLLLSKDEDTALAILQKADEFLQKPKNQPGFSYHGKEWREFVKEQRSSCN